jgi:hypothetical protein
MSSTSAEKRIIQSYGCRMSIFYPFSWRYHILNVIQIFFGRFFFDFNAK